MAISQLKGLKIPWLSPHTPTSRADCRVATAVREALARGGEG